MTKMNLEPKLLQWYMLNSWTYVMLCKMLNGGLESNIQKERPSLQPMYFLMKFINVQANIPETGGQGQALVESCEWGWRVWLIAPLLYAKRWWVKFLKNCDTLMASARTEAALRNPWGLGVASRHLMAWGLVPTIQTSEDGELLSLPESRSRAFARISLLPLFWQN